MTTQKNWDWYEQQLRNAWGAHEKASWKIGTLGMQAVRAMEEGTGEFPVSTRSDLFTLVDEKVGIPARTIEEYTIVRTWYGTTIDNPESFGTSFFGLKVLKKHARPAKLKVDAAIEVLEELREGDGTVTATMIEKHFVDNPPEEDASKTREKRRKLVLGRLTKMKEKDVIDLLPAGRNALFQGLVTSAENVFTASDSKTVRQLINDVQTMLHRIDPSTTGSGDGDIEGDIAVARSPGRVGEKESVE